MDFVLNMPCDCRKRNRRIIGVLVCALLVGGCQHRAEQAPVRAPQPAAPVEAPRPRNEIAENTVVVASLVRAIGTRLNRDGEAFKARLTAPLLAASGDQIAAKGATVIGTVVSRVEGLGLRFDAIETARGSVNVRARLLEISPKASMETTDLDRNAGGGDVRICPPVGIQRAGRRAVDQSNGIAQCRGTVYLRAGTKLRLQLSDARKGR
jgi:hypothetical protein